MRMRMACLRLAAAVAMSAGGAFGAGGVGITPKVGTLGLGADVTLGVAPRLNLRAGYNGLAYDRDFSVDEAEVTGRLDWRTIPVLLDWHIFEGGFRLSAGGVLNNNEVSISADPTEPLEVQGAEYWIDSLDGKITFNPVGWYFGMGYGNAVGKEQRWHFACDFGVMYHGAPDVKAGATAADPLVQELLNQDLRQEVADFRADIKPYVWYPVISVGVSFKF